MPNWIAYLRYIPYALAGLLALEVALLLVALYNIRLRRRGEVWRVRHNAGKRGGRLLLIGVVSLTFTLAVSVFGGVAVVSLGYQTLFFPPEQPYGVAATVLTRTPSAVTATPAETSPALMRKRSSP